jgi:hypothetical protein
MRILAQIVDLALDQATGALIRRAISRASTRTQPVVITRQYTHATCRVVVIRHTLRP